MNKQELSERVSEKLGLKPSDVLAVIEAATTEVIDALVKGEQVRIVGFGAFEVRHRSARKGRNPNTGEEIPLAETKTPVFVPGKRLIDQVKGR